MLVEDWTSSTEDDNFAFLHCLQPFGMGNKDDAKHFIKQTTSISIPESDKATTTERSESRIMHTSSPFTRAIKALDLGPIFKTCTTLYADRKMVLMISFHLVATFICHYCKWLDLTIEHDSLSDLQPNLFYLLTNVLFFLHNRSFFPVEIQLPGHESTSSSAISQLESGCTHLRVWYYACDSLSDGPNASPMCRLLIATLSKTYLAKYIPISEMTR